MAQDIVSGLFGLTPQQVQAQQQAQLAQQAQAYGTQAPFQRAAQGMFQAGAGLGGLGAQAAGMVNPEVEAARQREAMLGQIDMTTPQGILQGAEMARQRGDVRMQMQLQMLAQQKQAETREESPFAKPSIEKFTPESIATFERTGRASDLRQIEKKEAMPASVDEYNFAKGQGYQGNFQEWMKDKAQSTRISIGGAESKQPIAYIDPNTGSAVWGTMEQARGKVAAIYSPETKGYIASATEAGKGVGAMNTAQYDAAASAVTSIEDIDRLITHINTSDAITGMGADVFKNIERAKAMLGGEEGAKKASDTEILDVMMGSEVFPMIKSLGVGARGMDTPAEREFMRSVLTGSIQLNKNTLLRMAKIRRDVAERSVNKWNKRTDEGELDMFYKTTGLQKRKFTIKGAPAQPAVSAPPGVDAAMWAVMTPEEKALWRK